MVFTGGDGTWATRNYTLLPDILHSTDYVTTAPGQSDRRSDHQRHAAGPARHVTSLNTTSSPLSTSVSSTARLLHRQHPGQLHALHGRHRRGRDIAASSTVRMTSDRNFWGVTAYDQHQHQRLGPARGWPRSFLTNFYTVSFGPATRTNRPTIRRYANAVFVATETAPGSSSTSTTTSSLTRSTSTATEMPTLHPTPTTATRSTCCRRSR